MRTIKIVAIVLVCLGLFASAATAQETEAYPLREVERPIFLLPKMFELSLFASYFETDRVFDLDGELESMDGDYNLISLIFDLDYCINERFQVGARLPYYTGEIGDMESSAIGDVSAYIAYSITRPEAALSSAVFLYISYPSGIHNRKYKFGDDEGLVQSKLITGDPSWDLMPALAVKYRSEDWAIQAWAQYIYKFGDTIQENYANITTEESDMDPGDAFSLNLSGIYQISDRFAALIEYDYESRQESEIDHEDAEDEMMMQSLGARMLYHSGPDTDLFLGAWYVMDGINTGAGFPVFAGISTRF